MDFGRFAQKLQFSRVILGSGRASNQQDFPLQDPWQGPFGPLLVAEGTLCDVALQPLRDAARDAVCAGPLGVVGAIRKTPSIASSVVTSQ